MMNVAPYVHMTSKTRSDDRTHERMMQAVAKACYGVTRLMPVIYLHQIIGWCGWSMRLNCAIALRHKPWMRTWIDRNGLLCGFVDVDDLISKVTQSGNFRQLHWFKQNTGTSLTGLSWSHLYQLIGYPTPGSWSGTAYTARRHDDTELGALMHGGNVSPATKHLISGHVRVTDQTTMNEVQVMCLYDMVISYDNSTLLVTNQTFTNTLTAQRYISGGDPGLQIMGCGATAQVSNATYTSVKYTSIGGTSGQTVPSIGLQQCPDSSTPSGTTPPSTCFAILNGSNVRGMLSIPLVVGDGGVKQIDSVQMSATVTDANNYILGFQLAWLPFQGTDVMHAYDFVKQIPSVPRIRDGACLTVAMMFPPNASSVRWQAGFNVAWG